MDIDFASLAARIAGDVGGLEGCIIVSRDGLVLGAHPEDAESRLRPAWLRFNGLGEVEKGFVEFSGETWVFVHRGPYAAFAVCNPSLRPGLLMEEMEQGLLTAEEARTRGREGAATAPESQEAPRSKPRAPLHPEAKPAAPAPAPAPAPAAQGAQSSGQAETTAVPSQQPPAEQAKQAEQTEPVSKEEPPPELIEDDPGDVDRVLLAQEFSKLLEESGYDDEEEP
ncbi:MAG: hypothetical protein WD276_04875 [Actinomycetota bacterium]